MKRLVCALLAITIMLGSSVQAFAFLPPDRLSESLAEKQDIAFETTVQKQGNKALSSAAVNLGRNLDGTIDFSHYINKKTLTLEEYNAFRWSFIFSQFAHPFQDNMQTIFNQSLFQQMETQGLQLQSVAEALTSVTEMDLVKIGTSGMMLQGSDFKELKDTIVGNLYYMSVYNAYGGGTTINDIFFGGGDAGQVFYVYDYVSPLGPEANDYYFDQARLGREGNLDGNYQYKSFPCFVLNNVSMMYLQIAFGAYLKSQAMDYGTFQERWGTYNVYLDSYGNLCTYDGEKYVIFYPNFANSIFINTEDSGQLEERVFAYNKWMASAYSTSLREHNQIQPERIKITCLGGKSDSEITKLEDNTEVLTTYNGYSAYYHTYIRPFQDKNNIKNSMIFIDPPEVSPAAVVTMKNNGVSIFQSDYDAEISDAAEVLARENTIPMLKSDSTEFGGAPEIGIPTIDFGWWQAVKGTLSSPVDQDGNLGFGGASGNPPDEFPILQTNVSILKGEGFFTLPETMNNLLKKTTWRFQGLGNFNNGKSSLLAGETNVPEDAPGSFDQDITNLAVKGVATEWATSRRAPLAIMNECYAIAMSWDFNKIIPNKNYFQSSVGQGNMQYASTVMFIRDKLIDYGQDMDVYLSEPGMYIPEWKMFWTGDTESFLKSLAGAVKDTEDAAKGSIFTSSIIEDYSGDTYKVVMPQSGTKSESKIWLPVEAPELTEEQVKALKDYKDEYPGCDTKNGKERIKQFLAAVKENALDIKWWGLSTKLAFDSFEEFYGFWAATCNIYNINSEQMLLVIINAMRQCGIDWDLDGLPSRYFISQYYLLSRDNRIDGQLGANTINDMALCTYFWDRYYMPDKMAMLGILLNDIWANKDLVQDNLEEGRESFSDWSEMNVIENSEEEMTEDRSLTLENYIYKYLRPDDIIFLPFASSTTTSTLRVYYTPHEELIKTSIFNGSGGSSLESPTEWETWSDADLPNTHIRINYHDLLMCLQKNTDYVHNYQLQPTIIKAETKNYSVEDLMTIAGEFATNPVSAIKYILSGMMFDAHRIFGIGPLGSSFDLNWITTNPIYVWVSARYVSILAVIICLVILIRVIRYLMSHKKDSLWYLMKDCGLIMCVSIIPILVLNSFIWCFSMTSKGLLREASYKSLLYETQLKTAERINADAAVDTEIAIFKQQFSGLEGIYNGITFEYIQQYDNLSEKPIYREEAWVDMLENVKFQLNYPGWYDKDGFVPVHRGYYDKTIFYFFYDYLKSSMINYYARSDDSAYGQYINLCEKFDYADTAISSLSTEQQRDLMLIEQSFAMSRGGFRHMLQDTEYVYGESVLVANEAKYGKPYMRDIWGMYMIFESPDNVYADVDIQNQIQRSGYWATWVKQKPLQYWNRTFRELHPDIPSDELIWTNPEVIMHEMRRTQLYTSILDAYNPSLNPNGTALDGTILNQRYNPVELTVFETQLMQCIERSYDDIMSILNLMPDQISDETAISVAAIVLTCNLNDMMSLEPSMPILSSLNMDMLLRTILIRDISHLEGGINLLYGLLDEGFGLIGVFAVILFEVLVAVLFVLRVGLIVSTMVLSLTYAIVQFGFKDFNYRRKLLIGCISQYVGTFLLHTISLLVVYGMAKAISFLHAVPIIGTLGILALGIVAFFFLGKLHIKMWQIFLADWKHLGGAVISSIASGKLQKMKAKIASLAAKFDHTHGLTENEESQVGNALMNVENSENVDMSSVQQVVIDSTGTITGRLNAAERSSTTELWDESQIPPLALPPTTSAFGDTDEASGVGGQSSGRAAGAIGDGDSMTAPDGTVVMGAGSGSTTPRRRDLPNIIDVEYTVVDDIDTNTSGLQYPMVLYDYNTMSQQVRDIPYQEPVVGQHTTVQEVSGEDVTSSTVIANMTTVESSTPSSTKVNTIVLNSDQVSEVTPAKETVIETVVTSGPDIVHDNSSTVLANIQAVEQTADDTPVQAKDEFAALLEQYKADNNS